MNDYFICVEVSIKDGILSPEAIAEAKGKIPEGYQTKDNNPVISLTTKTASLVFKCVKKTTKSPLGKSALKETPKRSSRNSY